MQSMNPPESGVMRNLDNNLAKKEAYFLGAVVRFIETTHLATRRLVEILQSRIESKKATRRPPSHDGEDVRYLL